MSRWPKRRRMHGNGLGFADAGVGHRTGLTGLIEAQVRGGVDWGTPARQGAGWATLHRPLSRDSQARGFREVDVAVRSAIPTPMALSGHGFCLEQTVQGRIVRLIGEGTVKTVECPNCGHPNPPDDYKCNQCSRHLYVFCPQCGQWELREQQAHYDRSVHPKRSRAGIDPNLVGIALVAVITAVIFVVLSALPTASEREAAKQDAWERAVERASQPSPAEQAELYHSR
jgi:hypothetical protein